MYLSIILSPLLGSIGAGFFGRFLGHPGSMIFSTSLVFFSFILSCFAAKEVALEGINQYVYLAKWIDSGLFEANWSFVFDSLTVVMLIVVTSISTLVHFYSTEYMKEDPHVPRFMSYISLFTFFMLLLVTGDNFMLMFVGWEGVGLCSFLLINFWFTRIQANKAAMKAMIMNRIGDVGLALGIFTIFTFLKAIDYDVVFSIAPLYKDVQFFCIFKTVYVLDAICFFLFIGAMGKSAQLGLHTWLPDAMEGPTPVSALIHAATMVTAGVFLLVRCSPVYEYAPDILDFVTVIGASTCFFAATVGLVQNDIKRVIAYSTCSQLGYMIFSCGISQYGAGMFHLSNHAFFKALLFLSAGNVIHSMADEQDMRRMGGLRQLLPYTYSMFLIGNLALMGFPFLSGFYSKDVILESAYAKYTYSGHFAYWLGTCAAFLTAFYSTRLMHMAFLSEPNGYKKVMEGVHESPFRMSFPLAILAILSIFSGYLTKDMFIGLGTDFWGNSIFIHPNNFVGVDAEFVPTHAFFVKYLVLIFSIGGALSAYIIYEYFFEQLFYLNLTPRGIVLYTFLNRKWMFDKVINDYIVQYFLRMSYNVTYKLLDKGFFELFGPTGSTRTIEIYDKKHLELYTGFVYHSGFMMLLGTTFFGTLYFLSYFVQNWIFYQVFFTIILTLIVSVTFILHSIDDEIEEYELDPEENLYDDNFNYAYETELDFTKYNKNITILFDSDSFEHIMSDAPHLRLYKDFNENNKNQSFYLVEDSAFWDNESAITSFKTSLEQKILQSNYTNTSFKTPFFKK